MKDGNYLVYGVSEDDNIIVIYHDISKKDAQEIVDFYGGYFHQNDRTYVLGYEDKRVINEDGHF